MSLVSGDLMSVAEIQGVQKLLSISNLAQFMDKLVSHLLVNANVHLCKFLPHHLAPASESTFIVKDNHLQLSASIKRFRSLQDVLLAVQNVLEVLLWQASWVMELWQALPTDRKFRSSWIAGTPWTQWLGCMRSS